MGEKRECRNCHFWTPGDTYPHYDRRGTCSLIHATGSPDERAARVYPVGNSWLDTAATFACNQHLPNPKLPES
jgi:hypothetical protein